MEIQNRREVVMDIMTVFWPTRKQYGGCSDSIVRMASTVGDRGICGEQGCVLDCEWSSGCMNAS